MTITKSKPQMRSFRIESSRPDGTQAMHQIEAAYFQSDSGFTTFKDDENQAVFSVRNDCLTSVERVELSSEGDTSAR